MTIAVKAVTATTKICFLFRYFPCCADLRRQQNILMLSHPNSKGLSRRNLFTSTVLRISLMFIVGCSLRAIVMQFLTYCRLAGHLIFLPFASALQATVACLTATF